MAEGQIWAWDGGQVCVGGPATYIGASGQQPDLTLESSGETHM